ncbi:MAG: endonuclease/exonuclease/phosphatase family protein [Thermoguttaceae bacterium]|jgi:endonuclease/exonuclease/phosphatase family metal-dependent hydrolase
MKIRKLYICLTAAVLIGGGIWHASLHRPTGPAEGMEIQGTEFLASSSQANSYENNSQLIAPIDVKKNQQSSRLRIGTFNIHSCKGLDGRRDVDRVAKCLKGIDFAGLNEVQGSNLFEKQDQAALLGQRLGMAWLFAPAIRQWYWMEAGNALLTRLPVIAWHRIPLVRRVDYSYRNAVQLDLRQESDPENRVIHVLLTHVNRRYDSEREAQLKEVISMFVSMAEPAVLLGDLNSTAQDAQIRQLMSSPGVIDAVGQVLGAKDPERIDWIFVRGLRCLDAGIVENDASDHPLVWAELE